MTTYYRDNGGAAALAVMERVFTGLEYRFGGAPPGPTDCSGVFEYGYSQVGVGLSRATYVQYTQDPINNKAIPSEPGDGLFIPGTDAIGKLPGHVMIYVSPGVVFQAEETGTRIGLFHVNTDNWSYRTRPALELPLRPAPKPVSPPMPPARGTPTAAQLKQTNLVKLPNVPAAELAVRNGFALWYFSEKHDPPFVAQIGGEPSGVVLYANAAYKGKKAA